jgi:virulence-associated protein VapD
LRKTRTQCLSERTENNHGTLVWIVGFRAGMKHQTFRVCAVRSITVWPLANHIMLCATEFVLILHLQACSHTTHVTSPRLIPDVSFFLPLLLQRQSTVSPPRRLKYYDFAWGLTKVLLKEKGLAAVSRLRRCYLVEVRNLNDRVSDFQRCVKNLKPYIESKSVLTFQVKVLPW